MNRADEAAKLIQMIFLDPVGEKKSLQNVVRIGDGRHGEEIFALVFEDKRGDRAGRGELGKILQRERFAMDTGRIGEPIDIDAELGECLLNDPRLARGAADEDGFVGDAAAQIVNFDLFGGGDAAGIFQIFQQLVGLFDVNHGIWRFG